MRIQENQLEKIQQLEAQNNALMLQTEDLQARVQEAEDALRAIRSGEVDALVVYSETGERVYTLEGADHPYRVMVETIYEGAATMQTDGTLLYCNQQFAKMLGVPLEALLGKSLTPFIDPPNWRTFDALLSNALKGNNRAEIKLRKAGGTELPALFSVSSAEIKDGVVICVVVTDLTEQKQNEELRIRERQFHQLANAMPQLVWTARADGTIDYFNERCSEYEEITACEDGTWEIAGAIHPDDRQQFLETWKHSVKTSLAFTVEMRLLKSDQNYHWHLNRAIPICNKAGEIVKWFGTATDIHTLKQAQTDLEELTEKLSRSNQELEQFAFVASHDLQEPLRKIRQFGSSLRYQLGKLPNRDSDDSLTRMQDAAGRMEAMINSMLALSRVNTNGGVFENHDLNRIASEAVSDLDHRVQLIKARVTIEELPSAQVDKLQVHQLFLNLIANALKFHKPEVPPTITISAGTVQMGKRPAIRITVQDNGIGIDEQYKEEIFKPFRRLHGRNEYEGTGIGLAICKKIVERHHGKIELRSNPGEGSAFDIWLPLSQG